MPWRYEKTFEGAIVGRSCQACQAGYFPPQVTGCDARKFLGTNFDTSSERERDGLRRGEQAKKATIREAIY